MSFAYLPTELYDAILSHIPATSLQATVLAVTRAIPHSPVSRSHLFRNIRITHPEQAVLLYQCLRKSNSINTVLLRKSNSIGITVTPDYSAQTREVQPTSWVRELAVESWSVDADIVVNILHMLTQLQSLQICVGPSNFTPEHLEELFHRPLTGLTYLALRFRPYVQKAIYYQFLKGAYFDSALFALARWPSSVLPVLSIVQDAFCPGPNQIQAFAQPIVFFRLDTCLSVLLDSPSMASSLKALRLRIPSRQIIRSMCPCYPYDLNSAPNLEFLDLSTCNILENEVDMILVRFSSLKHLVLDGCYFLRGEIREGDWNALGKRCALAGVRRAKQREKALKAWIEARSRTTIHSNENINLVDVARRVKRGRRGLATATISLRDSSPPAPSSSLSLSPTLVNNTPIKKAAKIRILPSEPTLKTLSVTISSSVNPDKYPMIRAEFDAGWAEGVALLAVAKARLRSSAAFRVMRTCSAIDSELEEQDSWPEGLEDIDTDDDAAFGAPDLTPDSAGLAPPVLCFAGASRSANHEENCGHSVGWELMKDEL